MSQFPSQITKNTFFPEVTPTFEVINEARGSVLHSLLIGLSAELFFPPLTVNNVQN